MTSLRKNDFLLSICIPTYNRAEYLDNTLCSIVSQKRFQDTNDVEIVISDNCSNDNTRQLSQKYVTLYPEKIRYYANSVNIEDQNFEKVLSYGRGQFLKLNNDTLLHYPKSLDKMLETINANTKAGNIVFFSNGVLKDVDTLWCRDLDSFVGAVSFYSTWIACFGVWKKDFPGIENFNEVKNLKLISAVLFGQISLPKTVFIDNTVLFKSIPPKSKGGYNIYRIFAENYVCLLENYRKQKKISRVTLFNEKTKLMLRFLVPWTVNIWRDKKKFAFDHKGGLGIVFRKYWSHPSFYIGILYLFLRIMAVCARDFIGN